MNFSGIQKRFSQALSNVRGRTRISEADLDLVLGEIRTGLLEGDVHFRVAKDFLARVRERCLRQEVLGSLTPEQQILGVLKEELTGILGGANRSLDLEVSPPATILMCGLQGSGKTTTTVKLGALLQSRGRRVGVVSVDVYRPAAIDQLQQLASRAGLTVIGTDAKEPGARIVEKALQEARKLNLDTLLVDTAGRLQIDQDLMDELKAVHSVIKPAETLLVVDAMMGQQAVDVAEGFDRVISLSGLVLTKLDGDTRGGAALSLVATTGKPIKFIGTGERPNDLEPFHPDRMASRLLDMGDVLSLIEKAERVISQEEAERATEKIKKADFTLEDFRDQLKMLGRMGSLGGLLQMLPGLGQFREALDSVDSEKEIKRINAILNSMTIEERQRPDVLNGSRRARIARGSGTGVNEVNQLIKRFLDARKMMKSLGKMGGLMKGLGGGTPTGSTNPLGSLGPRKGGRGFGRKF